MFAMGGHNDPVAHRKKVDSKLNDRTAFGRNFVLIIFERAIQLYSYVLDVGRRCIRINRNWREADVQTFESIVCAGRAQKKKPNVASFEMR